MIICQECTKFNKKKYFKLFLFFIVFFGLILFKINKVYAQFDNETGSQAGPKNMSECINAQASGSPDPSKILVFDSKGCEIVDKSSARGRWQSVKNWLAEKKLFDGKWEGESAAAMAYKKAFKFFLDTVAYDTATYLASGNEGQKAMFFTEDFGSYIKNTADNAAGTFLETLGSAGLVKFNLCEPDLKVAFKIRLGLLKTKRPDTPDCSFSKMVKNWDKELNNPNFLNNFQVMFNPEENDLGIALGLQTGIEEYSSKKVKEAEQKINQAEGWKPLEEKIGGNIKTPASLVRQYAGAPINEQASLEKARTGDIFADAIDVFINTLAGKLLDKWFKKGLVTDFPKENNALDNLSFEGSGGTNSGGIAGAKDRFKKIIQPNFNVRGDYNILAELTQCPDPNKAGPTNCVITDNFSQAVSNKLTVGEALTQGHLNSGGVFGFMADGLEPKFNEGYPYRSMIILRKFRIIPAGWEIASQYIKNHSNDIKGAKNLGDLVACFDASDNYKGYYDVWCDGLVDPTWVLKAPLNFCRREGSGPEITNTQVVGSGTDSELAVSRNENYCADEQSCIKEKDDGSCVAYGYCVEEKRKWKFNGESCEPNYNTCQTFRAESGQSVSYLENTLNYGTCSVSNAGCKWYCEDYDVAAGKWTCDLTSGDKINFDRDAEVCESGEEGCHEFIRTKGTGANLLPNSGFEEDNDSVNFALTAKDDGATDGFYFWGLTGEAVAGGNGENKYEGSTALKLGAAGLNKDIAVGPDDYANAGEAYTLSFYAKDCGNAGTFNLDDSSTKLETSANWQYFKLTKTYLQTSAENKVKIKIADFGASCIIDAIKLERGKGTNYNDYRKSGLVYEKLLPEYLENSCYNDVGTGDYELKADAPAECAKFARKCNVYEVGCNLYTSETDGSQLPASTVAQDYCPAECVGYDTFIQKASVFDSLRDSYFIPKTAKTCGAETVGCDEFTNLDKAKQGGEDKEYYTYLKQCMLPDAACAEFYTWEGSDEAGYQLKVFSLKNDGGKPAITDNGTYKDKFCNSKDDYNLKTNPDCREFYNTIGAVSYKFYPYTISCSDSCKPYRRTENNIDPTKLDEASCGDKCSDALADGDPRCWDSSAEVCYLCKNGGKWDSQHQACLYDAIPNEGEKCSAAAAGCREYAGNTGNNTMDILNNNFEGGVSGWLGLNGSTISPSNNSLAVGGQSLLISGGDRSASTIVGQLIKRGNAYVLSFIAQGETASIDLTAYFTNGTVNSNFAGMAAITSGEWRSYQINLPELGHDTVAAESLVIKGTGNFFIDDLRITEISDRYYLIKNSWNTPASCFNDIYGNPAGPFYNLGCDKYKDRDNKIHNLHSFNRLCQDSAVGCELMIDTNNSSAVSNSIFNDNDSNGACDAGEVDCVNVPADNYSYVVYDKTKECSNEDKGCGRFGDSYQYENSVLFGDAFLKNDPDKYASIMCLSDEASCREWKTSEGASYFKEPGDQVCEWRQEYGKSDNWQWFKKKVKRCDANNDGVGEAGVCLKDGDCVSPQKCLLEKNDIKCETDSRKTFGNGGIGNEINQPTSDLNGYWAGICPAAQSSCSEYIDPLSKFSINNVFNGDFSMDSNNVPDTDGWNGLEQKLPLEIGAVLDSNTLYTLAVQGNNTATISLLLGGGLAELSPNNTLAASVLSLTVTSGGGRASKTFYASGNLSGAKITVANAAKNNGSSVEVKKTVIVYQLKQELDHNSCNGVVNFNNGCILFNERTKNGSNYSSLNYDTDRSLAEGAPNKPNPVDGSEDSNALIKVAPDRVCDKWLACKGKQTTEQGVICLGIGICDNFDNNGECARFIDIPTLGANPDMQIYPTTSPNIDNASGYVKIKHINAANGNFGTYVSPFYNDDYKLSDMEPFGVSANISNWDFESATDINDDGDADIPYLGWTCSDNDTCEVIDNPVENQNENICFKKEDKNCSLYSPSGNNFLKLSNKGTGFYYVSTQPGYEINVAKDREYTLSAYVNTKKITDGQALLRIDGFKESGAMNSGNRFLEATGWSQHYRLDVADLSNQNWRLVALDFKTPADVVAIQVVLMFSNGASGSYYIDNIKIKPTLKSRDGWKTMQSCRLYPKNDSLACEYYDDSGIRYKGWPGFCLEYDRYPGNSDVCLLWWATPGNADMVTEFCGDGIPNGEEDCDCGKDANGKPLYDCMSGSLPNGGLNAPASYGTHQNNQYRCLSCTWAEGWCGDGDIQTTTNSEHCDWNDANASRPNLKEQTCWSDHSTLEDHLPAHNVTDDFAHPGKGANIFTDYLYGNLGCYNNSNYDQRCRFNDDGCKDTLINNVHSRKECMDACGIVVAEILQDKTLNNDPNALVEIINPPNPNNGAAVVNPDGSLKNGMAGPGKNYFCKFNNDKCANVPGGWTQYKEWSKTTFDTCETNSCAGDFVGWVFNPIGGVLDLFESEDGCGTGQHDWLNKAVEQCKGERNCNWPFGDQTCTAKATINAVGCY